MSRGTIFCILSKVVKIFMTCFLEVFFKIKYSENQVAEHYVTTMFGYPLKYFY